MNFKSLFILILLAITIGCNKSKNDSPVNFDGVGEGTGDGVTGGSGGNEEIVPPTSWITQLGSITKASGGSNTGADWCLSSTVDSAGNVYCAGKTSGSMGEANGGGDDAFVMKVDPDGNLLWLKQLGNVTKANGNNSGNERCNGVSVDSAGNVYCAGKTSGPMGEVNAGMDDAFVMKLDSSGNLVWLKQLGAVTKAVGGSNAGSDSCTGVGVDAAGNVYCAGSTTGSMAEGNGGSNDVFALKLDSNGNLLWLRQLGTVTKDAGGSNSGADFCSDVSVDSSGNVYCGGFTSGAMGEAHGGGGLDIFVMKLSSSGNLVWLTQLGAFTQKTGGTNNGMEYCYGISVDSAGNVYCAGMTSGSMGENNGGGDDAFILKLDSSGNLNWITQMGATTKAPGGSNANADLCNDVSVDSIGNVYCTGWTLGSMGETNAGDSDAFVVKLDSNGELVWLTQLGATTKAEGGSNIYSDFCYSLSVSSSGHVYCVGRTSGDMGEANGGSDFMYVERDEDVFVLKLNPDGSL